MHLAARRTISVRPMLFVAVLSLLLVACTSSPSSSTQASSGSGGNTVTLSGLAFSPTSLTVKVGTTVTWKNRDDIPHTVVSAGKFRSKTLDTDDSFAFTFTTAGDYTYFCSLHPHMKGTIKVE